MAIEEDGKTLMDVELAEQRRVAEEHTIRLSNLAREIDAILVRENVSCGEWGEIVELFSERIGRFVAKIKINNL